MKPAGLAALGAAGGAAAFACYHAVSPTSQLFGPTICRVPSAHGRIALTYDDGPSPRWTRELLDLLDRYEARATFFVIGKFAAVEPGLVAEIAERGHALGNHTWSHPSLPTTSDATLRGELERTRAAVESSGARFAEVDGRALMRPPYGRRRPGTLRTLADAGYAPVLWSITCFDWRRTATARAIARRASRARDGDIVLLHDGSDRGLDADRSRTLAATQAIVERGSAAGYAFPTLPELVASGSPSATSSK